MLKIKKFVVNPLQENSLVVYDESKECIIIDAGFYYGEEEDEVCHFIEKNELTPVRLINTHCHFDHLMGVEFLRKKYALKLEAHKDDAFLIDRATLQAKSFGFEMQAVSPIDVFISEKDKIVFGNSELEIIHVPGHAPGHVALYSKADNTLIAGDILFYGSVGRADLPGGDYNTLIQNIKNKLLVLPEDTLVYCGHGPETNIGFEKQNNPFLT